MLYGMHSNGSFIFMSYLLFSYALFNSLDYSNIYLPSYFVLTTSGLVARCAILVIIVFLLLI